MDNTEYFESLGAAEEEPEGGRCRVEMLQGQICTRFEPYREFFLTQPIARILPARPSFSPSISKTTRNYLQPDRQLKYLRGIIPQDYAQEAMGEVLEEEQHRPIRKLGNISALLEDTLYWAEDTIIKCARIWDCIRE